MPLYEFPFGIPADLYLNAFRKQNKPERCTKRDLSPRAAQRLLRVFISSAAWYHWFILMFSAVYKNDPWRSSEILVK
jgi:hypothetical protein